jgi:hypothetical protein
MRDDGLVGLLVIGATMMVVGASVVAYVVISAIVGLFN